MQPSAGHCPRNSGKNRKGEDEVFRKKRKKGNNISFLSTCGGLKKISQNTLQKKSAMRSTDVELPLRTLDGFPRISNARGGKKKLNNENQGMERACNDERKKNVLNESV